MIYIIEKSFSDADWTWVGKDKKGLLATFTTAGEGPAPQALFNLAEREEIFGIEDEVLKLPELTSATLCPEIDYKTVESYLKLSRRGFYAFDWSDVHKKKVDKSGTYELISKPSRPRSYSSLSEAELKLLFVISLPGADFTLCDVTSVRA